MVRHVLMVADRLGFLRQALMAFLTVTLSPDVADEGAYLIRLAPIDASFTSAAAGLRRHTLSNIILLSNFAARAEMSEW